MNISAISKFKSLIHGNNRKLGFWKKKSLKTRFLKFNLVPFNLWVVSEKKKNGIFLKNFKGDVLYVNSFFIINPFRLFFLLDYYNNFEDWLFCSKNLFYSKYNLVVNTLFFKSTRSYLGNSFKSKLRYLSKDFNFFYLTLPSGFSKKVNTSLSFFYLNRDIFKKNSKRFSVRGIAKNCVDHPNGGSSNTRSPFKTPWGKVAKFGR